MYQGIYEGFNDKDDVSYQFRVGLGADVKIIVASYEQGDYDGRAFVLFEQAGKLYEVNASHCSCYGLEDQWAPEEVTLAELKHRVKEGNLGQYLGPDAAKVLRSLARRKVGR